MKKALIIDYGMGNLYSVKSALEYLGASVFIDSNKSKILEFEYLILPGVGSYKRAMEKIRNLGIDNAIYDALEKNKAKILGICLGMQLLGKSSTEDGFTEGLNLIGNKVEKIEHSKNIKVPHIGFDKIEIHSKTNFFRNIKTQSAFYFVHSFKMSNDAAISEIATCNYGGGFVAAFQSGNIYGTQFHPEKSQSNGLQLIANFLS